MAVAAVVIMPGLAIGKRRVNRILESAALRADIAETKVCAFMAVPILVGAPGAPVAADATFPLGLVLTAAVVLAIATACVFTLRRRGQAIHPA